MVTKLDFRKFSFLVRLPTRSCFQFASLYSPDKNFSVRQILEDSKDDVSHIPEDITKFLLGKSTNFDSTIDYTFRQKGKLLRPFLAYLMAGTANVHNDSLDFSSKSDRKMKDSILDSQYKIAMISEMIHAASLVHDDIFDNAKLRRGKNSVFTEFDTSVATFSGSFIITKSSVLLSSINNPDIIIVLAQVLEDLVIGELMQLNQISDDEKRFQSYLDKTYLKTASLMSNSCKAVAILSNAHPDLNLGQAAAGFGKHLGIAFQLIDDVLDFEVDEEKLGKPSMGADLRSGVITGPILFAALQNDQVNRMIFRNFSRDDDIQLVMQYIKESNGIEQTRMLAEFHYKAALRYLSYFKPSPFKEALVELSAKFIQRTV